MLENISKSIQPVNFILVGAFHLTQGGIKSLDFEKTHHRVRIGMGLRKFWPNDRDKGKIFKCL